MRRAQVAYARAQAHSNRYRTGWRSTLRPVCGERRRDGMLTARLSQAAGLRRARAASQSSRRRHASRRARPDGFFGSRRALGAAAIACYCFLSRRRARMPPSAIAHPQATTAPPPPPAAAASPSAAAPPPPHLLSSPHEPRRGATRRLGLRAQSTEQCHTTSRGARRLVGNSYGHGPSASGREIRRAFRHYAPNVSSTSQKLRASKVRHRLLKCSAHFGSGARKYPHISSSQ